jgi:hypothetical protein
MFVDINVPRRPSDGVVSGNTQSRCLPLTYDTIPITVTLDYGTLAIVKPIISIPFGLIIDSCHFYLVCMHNHIFCRSKL